MNRLINYDSVTIVRNRRTIGRIPRESLTRIAALACLLLMGGFALAGPSGILAWSENNHLLAQREAELKQLAAQRSELRNRVALLNPDHADPDLAGELLRRNMNVVHPDEVVILLH